MWCFIYVYLFAGYYFSERGNDIWLGNARGNTFSRNHTTLDPNDRQFWKFGFHEIAIYDLPPMIDFVLDRTNQSQLVFLGYSQGGTSIFALLSERPEYNDKISLVHGMGAAVFMKNSHSILSPLLNNINGIQVYSKRNTNFLQIK